MSIREYLSHSPVTRSFREWSYADSPKETQNAERGN